MRGVINLRADHGVRANQHALSALNAKLRIPYGNFLGDVAFFPLRRSRGKSAIERHHADRQGVAFPGDDGPENVAHEEGRALRHGWEHIEHRRDFFRDLHFVQMGKRLIDGGKVFLDYGLAALAVSLLNGLFDRRDGFLAR